MSTSLLPTNFGQEKSSTVLEDLYRDSGPIQTVYHPHRQSEGRKEIKCYFYFENWNSRFFLLLFCHR